MVRMLLVGASLSSCGTSISGSKDEEVPFISLIEIPKFSQSKVPCIPVQVGETRVLMKIDLGFTGYVTTSRDFLDAIREKTFFTTVESVGMRGTVWHKDVYRVPIIQLANITYFDFPIEVEHELFGKESSLDSEDESPSEREAGRLGWRFFDGMKVLFDIPKGKILASNTLDELKKEGYVLEDFVKAPLFADQHVLYIESATSKGPLRWMLDTGATANHLDGGSGYNLENRVDNIYLQIEGKNFGPISAYEIPFKFPLPIDGILGMEFFEDHIVLIDFPERQVYFLPLEREESDR